jgi:TolB protein
MRLLTILSPLFALAAAAVLAQAPAALGPFDGNSDVGVTPLAGSVKYETASGRYTITGGGANMWAEKDAFQFVWKKLSGDVTLTADVELVGKGTNAHRKVGWMIRQDLEPDSAYADVVIHGDGHTSLQYREVRGEITKAVVAEMEMPRRIRLERRGDQFRMFTGNPGSELEVAAPVTVKLSDPVYAGLVVCSHDETVLETAIFTNVSIEHRQPGQ